MNKLRFSLRDLLWPVLVVGLAYASGSEAAENLNGQWQAIALIKNGVPLKDEDVKRVTFTFEKGTIRITGNGPGDPGDPSPVRLNFDAKPHEIDIEFPEEQKGLGIFHVDE